MRAHGTHVMRLDFGFLPQRLVTMQPTSISTHLAHYLASFHWQVWATVTFDRPVTDEFVRTAVRQWVGGLGSQAYAYAAFERGTHFGRCHAHTLVGGLFTAARTEPGRVLRAAALSHATRTWRFGQIQLAPYDPARGAARYASKCPDDGELIGLLKRHRGRRKRARHVVG